jgi:penicillin amidase
MPGAYTPYRIARIHAVLADGGRWDVASAGAMQADVVSVFAARVLPALLRGAKPRSEAARAALAMLAPWSDAMAPDRPEPLIFAAWIDALSRRLYGDKIGDRKLYDLYSGPRRAFLDTVLTGAAGAWCDDKATSRVETCADIAGPALDEAVATLQRRYGADMSLWRWGRAHVARFNHPLFAGAPFISSLFDVAIPIGGSGDTIFATDYAAGDYAARHGPSLRAVFDLSDLNRSRFIVAPGQSGHPLSRHYRDLTADWAAGRSFEIRTDVSPERPPPGFSTLTLTPR